MLNWRGLIVTLVVAGILAIPLYYYREFLTRGMRPSTATQRLNELEKDGIPNFTLPDLQGKQWSLDSYQDKIILINLWATWCAPCVKEFPSLKRLVEKMQGRLVVLAVSHDRSREDLETFIHAFGATPENFVVLWDKEKETGKLFGTDALPETYILDRKRKLVRKIAGDQNWDSAMALEFFEEIWKR